MTLNRLTKVNMNLSENMIKLWNTVIYRLSNIDNLKTIDVTADKACKYKGDFYGLLKEAKVPAEYFYPVLRVNGYYSSSDYNGIGKVIYLPDENKLSLYYRLFKKRVTE